MPYHTWTKSALLVAAGLFALTIGGPVFADDNSAGPGGSVNAGGGPVLYLSGNPVVDWYRVNRFERRLADSAGDSSGSTGDGQCYGDPGACHGSSGCHEHRWGVCRLGCLAPDGGCGHGVPCCRCYHMTYAANPWYFDSRDGKVYAASGWGAPMAVPLAPQVTQQYNYGWGIPSSRITPISRMVPAPGAIQGAGPVRTP